MSDRPEASNVAAINLEAEVKLSLAALNLGAGDKAAARLAGLYAAVLDQPDADVERIGPKLLDVLEALGATPRARSRLKVEKEQTGGKLSAFRNAG